MQSCHFAVVIFIAVVLDAGKYKPLPIVAGILVFIVHWHMIESECFFLRVAFGILSSGARAGFLGTPQFDSGKLNAKRPERNVG